MLNLYAKAYGVDLQTARKEIIEATGGSAFKREQIHRREIESTRPHITNAEMAEDAVKHKTYTRLFEMLILGRLPQRQSVKAWIHGRTDRSKWV